MFVVQNNNCDGIPISRIHTSAINYLFIYEQIFRQWGGSQQSFDQ